MKGLYRGNAILVLMSLILSGMCIGQVQGKGRVVPSVPEKRLSEKSITVTITDQNAQTKSVDVKVKSKTTRVYADVTVLKVKGRPEKKKLDTFLASGSQRSKGSLFYHFNTSQLKKGKVLHSDGYFDGNGGVTLDKPDGVKLLKLKFTFYTYGKNEIRKVYTGNSKW